MKTYWNWMDPEEGRAPQETLLVRVAV